MNTLVLVPVKLHLRRLSEVLEVTWNTGEESRISCAELRKFCTCSSCRSRNVVGSLLINESTRVESLCLKGSSGVQIVFADGHDKGIFPWNYLMAISEGRAREYLSE